MLLIESSGCLVTDRRYALAMQWHAEGDIKSAIELLEQTADHSCNWSPLFFKLGELRMEAGERDKAIDAFRRCLELDPADRQGAIIKLSLLGASPQPQTLPAGYVESLFDQYAPRFDKALIENLSYNAPKLLADAVERIRPSNGQAERILDLGCGTGLAGEAFFKRASWLEGVDISAGMLAEAERKQVFHKLSQSDIAEYLAGLDDKDKYEIILAADVLVYLGELGQLFRLVSGRLAEGGLFAFSVQKLPQGDYLLQGDHRYAHSRDYLVKCAEDTGLKVLLCQDEIVRKDGGRDVSGLIMVCACARGIQSGIMDTDIFMPAFPGRRQHPTR